MDSGTLLSDRYRLDRRIDRGAMGEVWRARDERLDRDVAVKILLPGLEGAGERFEREAKTLASLKGRNYVEVYDYGEELDGDRTVQFLVMELVEGESLARVLAREGPLGTERTMRIIAEAADALGTAHRSKVVHRDVKPANLLIDADDRVRVVDFGISLLVDASRLTDSKEVLGTVPYVSPERLRNQDVTGKSDLYSLGAVAYECLTGKPPFPAQDPIAVIHSHLYEDPPPLPDSIPPEVAAIVHRSLKKDPDERWESGEALAEACRTAVTGEIAMQSAPEAGPDGAAVRPDGAGADGTAGTGSDGFGSSAVGQDGAGIEPVGAGPDAAVPVGAGPDAAVPSGAGSAEERRRKQKRLALLAIATVLAVALLGVVAWSPWTGDRPRGSESADDASTLDEATNAAGEPVSSATPSTSATESATPTAEGTESTAEGGTDANESEGDSGGDGSGEGDGEPEQDAEESEQPQGGSGSVPDVTGRTTFEARDYLYSLGFTNVEPSQGYFVGEHAEVHCDVGMQEPQAGTTVDYSSRITLIYNYEDENNGGGTSCEW